VADTITVTYKVNEDGSLSKIAKGADKAAKATDKASKAAKGHNKQQKGVAGATSNTTKGFSKMTTGMTGGLVPAYATLAANVFALSAAFGLLSRNDAIAKLNEGLELTGLAAGKNLGMLSRKLQEVTGHAISAEESMRAVAIGTSAGFSDEQLVGLTEVAKGAALALGRNMPDAIDRLIRGAAKLEPEILDELGIMVRLDDATKDYAKSVGKAVGQLTQFERRMAFTNAVIDQGQQKFAAIAAEMEASGYSKLSASFSDLTKQGIELLNDALKPIINFLAGNTAALTTVMLAFGASISSTLLSSLGEMAESSAQAGKQAANLSKHTVIGIKSQKHMGKAFNKSADAMKDVNLSAEDYNMHLKKMQQSSKLTVNMMSKENKLRKLAVKDRNHLTKAVHLAALAEHKDGAAKALNMIQTHGLSAAYAEHKLVLAANSATTRAATIGQDLQTQATIRARSAMFALGASAKFAGAAMITAMPYLMGIMAVASILGPLLKSLFGEKEDKLSKQIELNTERFEKFNDVVAKYNITVKHAATASEAWHNTVKPLTGLFEQINTAMTETNLAAETDRILAYAAATREVEAIGIVAMKTGPGGGKTGKQRKKEDAEAAQIAALTIAEEDLLTMRKQSTIGLSHLIASMDMMQEGLKKNEAGSIVTKDAQAVLSKSREEANVILTALVHNTDMSAEVTKKAQEELKTLADRLKAGLKAYEDFNEVVLQAKEQSATPTFGVMAKELDTLTESVAMLSAIDATTGVKLTAEAAEEQAKRLVDAYGIVRDEIKEVETIVQNGISAQVKNGVVRKETNVEAVEYHLLQVTRLNQAYKDLAIEQSTTASLAKVMGDDADYIYESVFENAKESLRLSKLQYELITKGGEDAYQQSLKVLEVEREVLAIVSKRMEVLAGRAEDSGMGAGASAAIAGVGKTAALDAGGVGEDEMFATETAKKEALAAQATQNARDSLAGVAEDIAKMGPEGALMSSAISGALNMSTAFSTAFEVMDTESASTSDKVQAGLGAIGATLGALSSMQKAASADKIRAIDGEIAAEKARDGKSKGSLAKLAALEKKKTDAKRKAFEQEKKMKMAQTVISTAQGVTAMLGAAPPPFNFALAGMVAAMGVKQLAMISSSTFQGGGGVAAPQGPSSIAMGSRGSTIDTATSKSGAGELGYLRGADGQGGANNFKPAFGGYKHRAGGGYVVGEQGPEVFMPETPGNIIPSGQGMGGTTNVNFSINAVDASGVEDLLLNQRGNLIGMMREAANSYGQDFMEGIDTAVYTPSTAGATKY